MPSAEEKEVLCGLGNWRPPFLQRFASKKTYMIIIGLLGIIQSMMYTYLAAMISTLERQFGITSKQSAWLMSGNEISQILFLFVMPLVLRARKRPLWMSFGLFSSGIGCIMMCLPHAISDRSYLEDTSVQQHLAANNSDFTISSSSMLDGMCGAENHPSSLEKLCDEGGHRKTDWGGLALVFFGIVLTGVGNCFFHTFGVPYLDDNMTHDTAPMWLSVMYVFRLIGPTLGFALASFCMKIYVIPNETPDFEEKDPRWIGAWWLGFPIIGACILILAIPLALFPERLP